MGKVNRSEDNGNNRLETRLQLVKYGSHVVLHKKYVLCAKIWLKSCTILLKVLPLH